jgi:hypothetical protein
MLIKYCNIAQIFKSYQMKKLFFFILLSFVFSGCDVVQQISTSAGTNGNLPLSGSDAAAGIKEALSQGLVKAVLQLNKEDGFFKDEFYKILLPADAKKIDINLALLICSFAAAQSIRTMGNKFSTNKNTLIK